jgi:hypothetical protein
VRKFLGLPPTAIGNLGLRRSRLPTTSPRRRPLSYAREKDGRYHLFTSSCAAFEQFLAANATGRGGVLYTGE